MEAEQVNLIIQIPWDEGQKDETPGAASTNITVEGGPMIKQALAKQSRRIQRTLRSPRTPRQPEEKLNINTGRERKAGKRKGFKGELDMDIDEDTIQEGKRSKVDCMGILTTAMEEGEGSNPLWTPMAK